MKRLFYHDMWFADKHGWLVYSSILSRKSISVIYWLFSRCAEFVQVSRKKSRILTSYPADSRRCNTIPSTRLKTITHAHAPCKNRLENAYIETCTQLQFAFSLVLLLSNDTIHVSSTTVISLRLLCFAMHFTMNHAPAEVFTVERSSLDRWQSVHTCK